MIKTNELCLLVAHISGLLFYFALPAISELDVIEFKDDGSEQYPDESFRESIVVYSSFRLKHPFNIKWNEMITRLSSLLSVYNSDQLQDDESILLRIREYFDSKMPFASNLNNTPFNNDDDSPDKTNNDISLLPTPPLPMQPTVTTININSGHIIDIGQKVNASQSSTRPKAYGKKYVSRIGNS
jgi:hypothetical protein